MNKIKIKSLISFYATPDKVATDIYLTSSYNRLCRDVNGVIGLIDKKLLKMNKSNDDKQFVCFVNSLLCNLMYRVGFFNIPKDEYINRVLIIYDMYERFNDNGDNND